MKEEGFEENPGATCMYELSAQGVDQGVDQGGAGEARHVCLLRERISCEGERQQSDQSSNY